MDITALLNLARQGDEEAGARAFEVLTEEMRRHAASPGKRQPGASDQVFTESRGVP